MNSRRLRPFLAVALAAVTALLLAACGGSKKPPAQSVSGHGGNNSGTAAAYRYSACMRDHGVSKFQNPRVKANGNQVQVVVHVDPTITGSPHFKPAQRACAHILPNPTSGPTQAQMHAREEAILAFAGCMRRHGFPRFPDPTRQGQLTPEMLSRAGIDLQQPAIRTAAYACLPVTHGIVTRADVNQATASPSGGSGSQSGGSGSPSGAGGQYSR